jgi:ABC-type lipopolysaccharide export system ATPase subunit
MGEANGSPDTFIRTDEVVKYYGKRRVVDDVSIQVDSREIVGLLGPNYYQRADVQKG